MSYIEREAAIKSAVGALKGVSQITAVDVASAIEEIPAADVVEVVRCKDCKWWKRMNGDKRLQCFHEHGIIRTTENTYCCRGERRENEKT